MNQSLIYHSPFSQKQNKIVKKVLSPNALNFAANLFSHRYSILQANSSETPPVDWLPKNALIKDRLHRHRHPLNNKINLNLRTWHQLKCCKCLVPLTDTVLVLFFLFHFLSIVFFLVLFCTVLCLYSRFVSQTVFIFKHQLISVILTPSFLSNAYIYTKIRTSEISLVASCPTDVLSYITKFIWKYLFS